MSGPFLGEPMSFRKRRCLLVVTVIAWALWGVAFAGSMTGDVGQQHVLAQHAILAIATVTTFACVVHSAAVPIIASLRAIHATRRQLLCDNCTHRRLQVQSARESVNG